MNITEIINQTAAECGITVVFARVEESKLILDKVRSFPILVRSFAESVSEGKNGYRVRRTMLYFCDSVAKQADTATKVAPVCDKMEALAFDFFAKLRKKGVTVEIQGGLMPQKSNLKAEEAGMLVTVSLTYNPC